MKEKKKPNDKILTKVFFVTINATQSATKTQPFGKLLSNRHEKPVTFFPYFSNLLEAAVKDEKKDERIKERKKVFSLVKLEKTIVPQAVNLVHT